MINRIPAAPYLGIFLLLPLCWGCASFDSRPKSLDETDLKFERYARKIHQSFEMGKALSPGDPLFVEQQGELVLAETLRTFYSPYAGAQQLLSFTKRHPRQSLLPLYLEKDPIGRYFEFQDDEDFKSGLFFNNYEKSLFDPFYRGALLLYVKKNLVSDKDFIPLGLALKEAAKLTPRYADFFPNDLSPDTQKSFKAYLDKYPKGPLSDRFRYLLLAADRAGIWESDRHDLDSKLAALASTTDDELLKLEIQSTLDSTRLDPGRAFLFSAALPGAGQVVNGDLMGGVMIAGLGGVAWWWALSRLAAGMQAGDVNDRQIAFGDAAWRIPLVLFFHGFAAVNASSQARSINITIQWDVLNEPRLKETFQNRH